MSPLLTSATTAISQTKSAVKYARYARPSGRSMPTRAYGLATTTGTASSASDTAAMSCRLKRGSESDEAIARAGHTAAAATAGASTSHVTLLMPAAQNASSVTLLNTYPHAGPASNTAARPPGRDPYNRYASTRPGTVVQINAATRYTSRCEGKTETRLTAAAATTPNASIVRLAAEGCMKVEPGSYIGLTAELASNNRSPS